MPASDCAASPLTIRLFGPFEARLVGIPLPRPRTRKAHWLLALLALRSGTEVERAWLAGMLWPDSPEPQAYASLRNSLADLRGILGPEVGRLQSPSLRTLSLDLSHAEIDVVAFDTAIAQGDTASLERAVRLYRGPLLEGCAEEWVFQERQAREQVYLTALERLAAHALAGGEPAAAERHLRLAVAVDPLRESAQRALMQTLAAGGNYAAAMLVYRELRLLLHRELNAEPDPETQALFQQLRADARCRAQATTPASTTRTLAGDHQRLVVARPQPTASPTLSPAPQPATPAREPLRTEQKGENRIVTVLFADMSRSLETTEELAPEDAAALVDGLLRAMVEVIVRYEGRVDRFLGDGLLAVFGVPQTHEDDPERAIRAALEIREAAQRLGLDVSAGINTGEVYLGELGSEQHRETTVIGRAVNLAARLQEAAEPGRILVGMATYHQTRGAFEFASRSLAVKGLPQPVTAYAVERPLPRPEKARGIEGLRAELIGRDDELARLRQALAEVLEAGTHDGGRATPGAAGRIVSLIGEAGVGKSRLVAELKLAALAAPGARRQAPGGNAAGRHAAIGPGTWSLEPGTAAKPLWLEGRCLEMGRTAGYWLFVDLLRDYFTWRPDEDGQARGERLAACLWELAAQGDLPAERVEEMGPLLGQLLSLRFGSDWDDRLEHASPEQIKHQTFMAIRDFFVALARRRPVILVCEDLHWADSLSLDLISLLMEALTLAPLLLLCVYRPEREHKSWHLATVASRKCPERHTEISLRELTPPQSRRLVASLLTIENLRASVMELILEKAQGNPFFVEEVVRSLIASGVVYQEGNVWRAREGIETVGVPDSVQSVILSRVDRLEREQRGVLESASVIGRLFQPRLLEYTMQGTTELGRALGELEDQALIYQERVVPEEEYSFKHVLTQETIYQSLLRRQRVALHQKVAEGIEALDPAGLDEHYEELAYHYERSGADEKAVVYLLKAGEKARRAYLNEAAIGYFQRALKRLEGTPLGTVHKDWRLEARKGLGQIYHGMGKETEAEEQFRQAIAVGREMGLAPRELVRLYGWLGDVLWWQTRYDETIRIGEEGLALLGEDTACAEAAVMNANIAVAHLRKGNQNQWREFTYRNARFIRRLPYSEELRPPYLHAIKLYAEHDKNIDEAIQWLRDFERQAIQHHDLRALGQVHSYSADAIAGPIGDLCGVVSQCQQALDLFARIGDNKHISWCLSSLSDSFLSLGDLETAEERAQESREIKERVGNKRDLALAQLTIGKICLCQGALERATDAFQKARQLYRETSQPEEASAAHCLAHAYLTRGDRRGAVHRFQEAVILAWRNPVWLATALSGLEEACEDPEAFRAFCHRFRAEHPDAAGPAFRQWFLEPSEAHTVSRLLVADDFAGPLSSEWLWQDPFGDGSFSVHDRLQINAANGRDLWEVNLSAPRLLRLVSGNVAVQTGSALATEDKPAIGGILLWRDKENYLRLDRGTRGKHELSFRGCVANEALILGRGRLPSERIYLRLERLGRRVNALCSTDGQNWFTVGHADFPAEDPVQVGLHAIGNIDRLIYPGAYPEGTAIRFEAFRLWG